MPRPEIPPAPHCPTGSARQSSIEDSSTEQPLASAVRKPKASNRQSTRAGVGKFVLPNIIGIVEE